MASGEMASRRFVLVLLCLVAPLCDSFGQFAGVSDVDLAPSQRSSLRYEALKQGSVPVANLNELITRIKKSVDEIMVQKLQRTRELYKLPDTTTRHRGRREIPDQLTDEHDDFYDLVAAPSLPAAAITNCLDVESFSHAGDRYIVGATNGPTEQTILYRYNNGTSTQLQVLETPNVKDVALFQVGSKTYLIVMASDSETGSTIYLFMERFEQFSYIQRILTRSPTKVEAYATGGHECIIFVGAYMRTVEGGITRRVSAVYRWEGGHLDETNTFITGNAVDVHPFRIQSNVFVALANHTDSHILQYVPHIDTFIRYQDIEATNAVDFEHFYLGEGKDEDHFLAVATASDGPATSVIFKFHRNEFVPFQSIATVGAKLWHAMNNADGTLRVLALSSSEGTSFYVYNGWIFEKSQIAIQTPGLVKAMTSFIESGHMILVVADNITTEDNVYDLRFAANTAVQDLRRNTESTCDNLTAEVERLENRLDKLLNASENLVYLNSSEVQIITGNKTFQDNVTVHTKEANEIHANKGMILDANEKSQYWKVKANQTHSFTDLTTIQQLLDGAVRKTGPEQTIRGHKTFAQLTVGDVNADTVNVESDIINKNVNLTELLTNTWDRHQDQIVDIGFTIDGNVTVLGNLTVSGTLDGLSTSTIVTLSRNHTIIGDKTFQSPTNIEGNLDVTGLIDGVRVHEDNLLLTYGNQTIHSNVNVSGVVTFLSDVEVDGLVDGCDLATIGRDGVLTSGNFTVTGNKVFVGDLTPERGIAMGLGHTIDGVDVQDLDQTVLRTSGYQEVTAIYSFSQNVSISGDLTINGRIDGLKIPDDILVVNSPQQAVLAESWVLGDNVTVKNITVETSINGIQATGGGTGLDVFLTAGDGQTVEGAITFAGGLHLEGSSHVASLVDGVHIPSMTVDAVYRHGNQHITGKKDFASNVRFQQNLLVGELINGINITHYDSSALKLVENGPVVLDGDVELTALETNMAGPLITGGKHSFPHQRNIHDLVIQGKDDIIYGTKFFVGVASDENVEALTVNGINISQYFLESVRVISGQVLIIDRNVTFWDDVKMTLDLNISSGIIDGVYLPDLVTLTKGSVKSLTTFTRHVTTQALDVNHMTLSGLLNGYDVVIVEGDTLKRNAKDPQNVSGAKTFLNGAFVNGDLVVWSNTVGVDLSTVALDAVYVNDQHTVITADKIFGFVDVTHLDALDHIDGVHLPSLSESAVLQLIPQTILGLVDFTQGIYFSDNVTVLKTVNDYVIGPELLGILNVLNNTYDVELEFAEVIAEDSVTVDGLIDGFYMEDFVLRESEFQTISGDKRFIGTLTVNETVIVLLINGISIDDLNAIAVLRHESRDIQGNKTFAQGLVLEQNLTVTTLVDGVDVETLQANFAQMRNEVIEFLPNSTLVDVIILGNISINNTFDGLDIKNLAETYMSKSLSQVVTGHNTWQDTVTIAEPASLNVQTIRVGGLVNGVDLQEFDRSVWVDRRGDRVGGLKTFTKNATIVNSLSIGGTLNGLNMSNIMLLNRANVVTGYKTFTGSPLVVNGDINMTDWMEVDGVDVSEFKRNAVTIVDDYTITLPTFIEGIILRKNLLVAGEIDGVIVSRDSLLLLTGPQEITGVKTFTQDLSVYPGIWIYGLLNGVDLDDLLYNTLLISPNQTVTGDYTFISDIVLNNATTMANVNGIRIPELYRLIYTHPSFRALNQSLHARCQTLNKMHKAQQNSAIILFHLKVGQVIDTIGYNSWHAFYYSNTQWLVLAYTTTYPSVTCVPSEIYQWNETSESYEYYKSLYPKSAIDVDSFVVNERLFLVVASKPKDTGECDNFPLLHPGDDVDGIVTLNRTSIPWYSYSTANVLVWVPDQETFYLYQALPCISPSDVEVFVDPLSNETCVVIANQVHIDTNGDMNTVIESYVYCLESLQSGFYLKDYFTTSGASRIRHFFKDGALYLAVANHVSSVTNSYAIESAIFQQQSNGLFTEVTTMDGNAVSDILPVTIEGKTFIIVGNEFLGTVNDANYDIPVEVYRLTDANTLAHQQDIATFGVMSLAFFTVENQFYIITVDRLATTVYKYSGIDNFVKVHTISGNGATSVHVFPFGDTGLMQVAVSAYEEEPALLQGQDVHPIAAPSVILDFVLFGERTSSVGCSNYTAEEETPGNVKFR